MRAGIGRLIALAGLFCAAAEAWTYEVEAGAGARIGSDGTEAIGSLFWDAFGVAGAYALGTTGSGVFSINADGSPGLEAELRTDATYAAGRAVSGLRLEVGALRSPEEDTESLDLWASAPIVLNGSWCSLSLSPRVGVGFLDEEFAAYGAEAAVSLLVWDLVVKPGVAFVRTQFADNTVAQEILPSIGVVWYPGLPATADFSAGWSRMEYDDGTSSVEYPFAASLSVMPAAWLGITTRYRGAGDGSGPWSHWVSCEVEPIVYGRGGRTIRFPLRVTYSRIDGAEEQSLSVSAIVLLR